jgi:hypothetical protein
MQKRSKRLHASFASRLSALRLDLGRLSCPYFHGRMEEVRLQTNREPTPLKRPDHELGICRKKSRNRYRILVRKPQCNTPHERTICIWKNFWTIEYKLVKCVDNLQFRMTVSYEPKTKVWRALGHPCSRWAISTAIGCKILWDKQIGQRVRNNRRTSIDIASKMRDKSWS